MGVSGKLSSSELPDDVVVFDLDTGKSMPEKPQVAVPSVIEQPLARLKNAHQWEQRQANKVRKSAFPFSFPIVFLHFSHV